MKGKDGLGIGRHEHLDEVPRVRLKFGLGLQRGERESRLDIPHVDDALCAPDR